MRISRVEVLRLPLTLREPYTIAYETISSAENVLLRLITERGHVGLGVAAPDEGVTGESLEICARALREVAEPLLHGADGARRMPLVEALNDALPGAPAARAAVDMALFDLLGKRAGMPVWRLLGGYRDHVHTSVTLFIEPPERAVARARDFVAQGFRALKIKGGQDVEEDIARVNAVRAAVGPQVELRYDANQGYSAEQAERFHHGTQEVGLSVFEQPTPARELDLMRRVVGAVRAPVMADESVQTLADAFLFAHNEAMDMVNLKLAKVGGIDAALLINGVARAAGVEVMVGCMDEAALSIACGLAFALSRRNVELADLDGHLDFTDDPSAACVTLREGALWPSEAPGFGLVDLEL
ncbi:MAG: dipeptide epimerase [Alphaproteobacteria bacterium]|nr:dipeptide epimerase [Alphaproteobacteria bacterium]MCB9797793.1 dipeptide epimerase [Alphaproteobacteria bacterium]